MIAFHLPHRPTSHRQKRIAEAVRSVVAMELSPNNRSMILDESGKPMDNPGFLTVTQVDVTGDLKSATIYVWPLERSKLDLVLPYLQRYSNILRRELAHQLKLRFTPQLQFRLDYTLDQAEHMDKLLDAQK